MVHPGFGPYLAQYPAESFAPFASRNAVGTGTPVATAEVESFTTVLDMLSLPSDLYPEIEPSPFAVLAPRKAWTLAILRYFPPLGAHSSGRIGESTIRIVS